MLFSMYLPALGKSTSVDGVNFRSKLDSGLEYLVSIALQQILGTVAAIEGKQIRKFGLKNWTGARACHLFVPQKRV